MNERGHGDLCEYIYDWGQWTEMDVPIIQGVLACQGVQEILVHPSRKNIRLVKFILQIRHKFQLQFSIKEPKNKDMIIDVASMTLLINFLKICLTLITLLNFVELGQTLDYVKFC